MLTPGSWPIPTQTPECICLSWSPYPARWPPPGVCALDTGHREHGHYLHPFFLMMFPKTASALQKTQDGVGGSSLQHNRNTRPHPAMTVATRSLPENARGVRESGW